MIVLKNKYKKLIKNTSIFAIGTFGSKLLVFLIVPLYTHLLSTSEYGIIDVFTSTINLFIPFATLLIYEAAIRFLISKEFDKKVIFNNCFFTFVFGCIFSVILSKFIVHFLKIDNYRFIFDLILILTSFTTIFSQYLRATGENLKFSFSGIITTFFTVGLNLIFLLIFKMGINGYLLSLLISQLITSLYLVISCRFFENFDLKYINFSSLKLMLEYSIPLVPNNIMWWIMNAGDKYIINFSLGNSANGIYSLSYKIPTILSVLFSIFMQAWQVSAIEEMQDKNRNYFYKNVFNYISFSLVFVTFLILLFLQPIFDLMIGKDFLNSINYVPLLCVATVINCYATFSGIVYIINKNSKKSFVTTFVGAIVNVVLNFLLIKQFDLYGVSIGTILGYVFVMLLRFYDFKKEFKVSLLSIKTLLYILLLIFCSYIFVTLDSFAKYIIIYLSLLIVLIISKNELINIKNRILILFKKK